MIDIRRLKELVKLMVENDLSELDLRDEQEQVVLRRPYSNAGAAPAAPLMPAAGGAGGGDAAPVRHGGRGDAEVAPHAPVEQSEGLSVIESPMVGTFYSSPDPESPAYVSVGDTVSAETVVCIVEAMKVFSEIKAEVAGTVAEVCVGNGEPVEYGQPLFKVKPA